MIELMFSLVLFSIGIFGFITNKDVVRLLISASIVLASATYNAVAFSGIWQEGHSFVMFVWIIEAVEVIIALSIFIYLSKQEVVDVNDLDSFKW